MTTVTSGWCSPGPLGSQPQHDACAWTPCDCPCHDKKEGTA